MSGYSVHAIRRYIATVGSVVTVAVVLAWAAWASSVLPFQRDQAGTTAVKAVAAVSTSGIRKIDAKLVKVVGIGSLLPPWFEFDVVIRVVEGDGRVIEHQVDVDLDRGREVVTIADSTSD